MSRINKYIKSFLMGFEEAMQYRTNFILGILSTIFPITIQVYIWKAVFMNDSEKLVYGFSYKQIIVYTLLSAIVAKFVSSGGFEWEVNDDIKNGGLNKYLVKPVGYFNYRICCALGKKIPQSTVIFILICIILAISGSIFGNSINALRITVFIVSLILAIVLNMLIIYCFSMVAFWISDAGSFFVISGIIINILSGGIFPLEIFGDKLNSFFNLLPFKYAIYFPVTIANGRLDQEYILLVILLQLVWIVILTQISKLLWNFGLKKYTAIGG